eukprot:gene3783-3830_t
MTSACGFTIDTAWNYNATAADTAKTFAGNFKFIYTCSANSVNGYILHDSITNTENSAKFSNTFIVSQNYTVVALDQTYKLVSMNGSIQTVSKNIILNAGTIAGYHNLFAFYVLNGLQVNFASGAADITTGTATFTMIKGDLDPAGSQAASALTLTGKIEFLAVTLIYVGCKKAATDPSGPPLSAQAVSSQVALNLSSTLFGGSGAFNVGGGLNAPSAFASHGKGKVLQSLTNPLCGLVVDTTLNYTVKLGDSTATIAVDTSNFQLDGSLSSVSSYKNGTKSGNQNFSYTLKTIIIDPNTGTIVSGSGTFTTSGTGPKGVWNYSGAFTFLGNQKVSIVINGKTYTVNLQTGVIAGILLGVVVGFFFKSFGPTAKLISQTFISLITMLIAPIIFFTIVLGIAGMSDIKKIVSTLALVVGLIVANILRPGDGFESKITSDTGKLAVYQKAAADMHWGDFLAHIVPGNIFDAFARGDILQILFFAVLFGFGLSKMGANGQRVISLFDELSQVFFNIMRIVMRLAPIGAFGGMAFTISTYGIKTLQPLAMLMGSVYITTLFFIFVVLNVICRIYKFSLWKYLKFIREEILIVFVIPAGYSFNLDGTTIYLSMSVIFLAQVFHIPLTLFQQLTIIGILMITSKGAAGVTGSGFIILTSTLAAIKIIPAEGVAILLGVDRFMSEARAITNMIGNGIATIVIAKSEGEFHAPEA